MSAAGEEAVGEARLLGVVVAAGSSSRMGGRDKLEALLGGKTVLRRSVEAMTDAGVTDIVIVTSPERIGRLWPGLDWLAGDPVHVRGRRPQAPRNRSPRGSRPRRPRSALPVPAGNPDGPVILVDDAARPLVSPGLVLAVALPPDSRRRHPGHAGGGDAQEARRGTGWARRWTEPRS